jgi:hypothetical protein
MILECDNAKPAVFGRQAGRITHVGSASLRLFGRSRSTFLQKANAIVT